MSRVNVFLSAFALVAGLLTAQGASANYIKSVLQEELAAGKACGSFDGALRGTVGRLEQLDIPVDGKVVLVNIAAQSLTAYEDGYPVLESKVVVGSPAWRTPELDTHVTYVRMNPTWTVPESILRARGWRQKLQSDPDYFARLNFRIARDGASLSPHEASGSGSGSFVQQPGPGNALGFVKFGLANAGAIYLHDTNDPALYSEANRARSHGCIRVEQAYDFAAWILGLETPEVENLIAQNDRRNRTDFPSPVRVILGYWTAWPDADGRVHYYDDVYNKDPEGAACVQSAAIDHHTTLETIDRPDEGVWTVREAR